MLTNFIRCQVQKLNFFFSTSTKKCVLQLRTAMARMQIEGSGRARQLDTLESLSAAAKKKRKF